jgi:AAA family ATP:ADP antiporter
MSFLNISLFYKKIKTLDKKLLYIQSSLLTSIMMITYILYCIKDSLIVYHIGPEAIVLLRTYLVVPFIFIFFIFYTKLLNKFDHQKLFDFIVVSFFIYFFVFSFFLYPNIKDIELDIPNDDLPYILKVMVKLLSQWPISLFYIIAELWVTFVLGVMTWQIFNAINNVKSASTSYYILQLISSIAVILTGQLMYQFGSYISTSYGWQLNLKLQTLLIIFFGLISIFMKNKLVHISKKDSKKDNFKKLNLSFKESIKLIIESRKIRSLFMIIFFYGVCNSFLETSSRYYIKEVCPSIQEYNKVLAIQTSLIGSLTIFFLLLGFYLSAKKNTLFL